MPSGPASPLGRRAGPDTLPLELTSFVGREREVRAVVALLGRRRLVTLTGPGGCGKTRLALCAASTSLDRFDTSVWWVGLGALAEGALVAQPVATALGVREAPGRSLAEAVADHLRRRAALLILDNCEHLVTPCAQLAGSLLRLCPDLRILVTSREALCLPGETVWVVPPLSLPEGRDPSLQDLGRSEAVRLFVERATAALSTFTLGEHNGRDVARICRRLEGMPLPIELAAARVRVLAVGQVAERLDDALAFLTGGDRTAPARQQTLRATLDWSHRFLSARGSILLARLAVFAGGFTLEAAEAVVAGDDLPAERVLDELSQLVDKSLVGVDHRHTHARYQLLETVRQYGLELLEARPEAPDVRGRHLRFFLGLAERAAPELKGAQQLAWFERLEAERFNLRAALSSALAGHDVAALARLGWALWLFWFIRGRFSEGRRWMDEALADPAGAPAVARARLLFVAGTMADGQGDYASAVALLEESLCCFRRAGDWHAAAYSLSSLGFAAVGMGDDARGVELLEESARRCVAASDSWGTAYTVCFSAAVQLKQREHDTARVLAEQGLACARETGDRQGLSVALYVLGRAAQAQGDHAEAAARFRQALTLSEAVGDGSNVSYCLERLASVWAAQGETEPAVRLWGAAQALLERIEAADYPYAPNPDERRVEVEAARDRLGDKAFAAAQARGRALTSDAAVAWALQPPEQAGGELPAGLTAREVDVLRLVAEGLTDQQIGQRLHVSPRTVGGHLGSIYRKLGVPSRTAAVRRADELGAL